MLVLAAGVKQLLQGRDIAAIVARDARVQRNHRARRRRLELGLDRLQRGPGADQRVADLRELQSSLSDCADQALDVPPRGISSLLQRSSLARLVARALLRGPVIFTDVDRDELRIEQGLLQAGEDAALEQMRLDRPAIGAAAALAAVAAAPLLGADDDVGAAAAAALHQPRQQPLRPAMLLAARAVETRAPGAYSLPQFVTDDAQLRRRPGNPFLARPDLDPLLSRLGVLRSARAVEHELSAVEVVLQDPVAAHAIAVDRGRGPRPAGWSAYGLGIQPPGDVARAATVDELGEDPAHDRSLVRIDLPKPPNRLPLRVEARDPPVAVGAPARVESGEHPPCLSPPRLVGEVLAVELRHGALEAGVQDPDVAFRQRDDARPCEANPPEDRCHVLEVARQTVEAFGYDDVAGGDALEQRVEPRACTDRSADRGVIKDACNLPSLALGALAADAHLVLDRGATLQRRRIAGIDQRAHRLSSAVRVRI